MRTKNISRCSSPTPSCRTVPALLGLGLALTLGLAGAAQATQPPTIAVPQIVGGEPVHEGAYPFMVSLRYDNFGHGCGGTLIAPNAVLTAAHCVVGADPKSFSVMTGQTKFSRGNGKQHAVASIHVYPSYEKEKTGDVAVIKLAEPVEDIKPITLVGQEGASYEVAGRMLTVAGWGDLSDGGVSPDTLQQVAVPFVPHAECQRLYQGTIKPKVEMCAGTGGKDSCQGDSGGPLFVQGADSRWIQLGVVSRGTGCALEGSPGIYARLADAEVDAFIRGLID